MRTTALMLGLVLLGCQTEGQDIRIEDVFTGVAGEWVDLSHGFSPETIYWPTAEGFAFDTVAYGMTDAGYFYSAFEFASAEHGGTHLDAPIHFAEGRQTTDEIPLSRLIGPAVVIDVAEGLGADDEVSREQLEAWEATHGRIPEGSIVLIRTDWSSRWGDALGYLGTSERGPEAVPLLHFPGLHPDAARFLTEERAIGAIGIDTASLDRGQSTLYESHQVLYGANVPGFENLTGLDRLTAVGSFVVALPMKIIGGSGGPLRIVAFVPAA